MALVSKTLNNIESSSMMHIDSPQASKVERNVSLSFHMHFTFIPSTHYLNVCDGRMK